MANPIELVKQHPVMSGTIAVVVVIGGVLLFSGGGGGTATTSSGGLSDAAIQASTQLQLAQGQIQAHAGDTAAALQGNRDTIAGNISMATLGYGSQDKQSTLAAQIAAQQIAAQQESTDLVNTLAAHVQGQQIEEQGAAMQAQYASLTAQINSANQLAQDTINAQVKIAQINKPQPGLFSWLFG